MKVSLIICSYNQGAYLEDAILSAINQNYENKEIILIDGGSTDESVAIIEKYKDYFKHWVSEPDRGQTHAINKGIEAATGDVVGWLNSDDIYLPKAIEKAVRAFQSPSKPNVVHGNRILIDEETRILGWSCPGEFLPQQYHYNICSEAAFWRRQFNLDGEMLKEELNFTMDLEWFSRIYVKYGNYHYLPQFLGGFRCHGESKSSTMQDVRNEEGPREWKRLFGAEIPTAQRPSGDFYRGMLNVRLTLWPALLRKLFNYRTSLKPGS